MISDTTESFDLKSSDSLLDQQNNQLDLRLSFLSFCQLF